MFEKISKDKSELFPGTNTGTANQLVFKNETTTNESSKFISQNQQKILTTKNTLDSLARTVKMKVRQPT